VKVSTKGCIDVADLIGKMILPNNRQKLKMGHHSMETRNVSINGFEIVDAMRMVQSLPLIPTDPQKIKL
jgi:hypothetical protein